MHAVWRYITVILQTRFMTALGKFIRTSNHTYNAYSRVLGRESHLGASRAMGCETHV